MFSEVARVSAYFGKIYGAQILRRNPLIFLDPCEKIGR